MTHIIVGGKEVPCAAPVVTWLEHGLTFRGLGRRKVTNAVVVHHTGANNLSPQVFNTLKTRRDPKTNRVLNLSVHFCIDPNGTVYQFCDTDLYCQHAGKIDDTDHDGYQASVNAVSVGIEVVNAADTKPQKGIQRAIVREEIHGHEYVGSTFTAEQTASTIHLVQSLCAAYRLPVQVPMAGADVLATVMSESAFHAWRGVLGHLHVTDRKNDPRLSILRAIAALTRHPAAPPDVI